MKNYHDRPTATDRPFASIELSDTLAENISGGMSFVAVSSSSDSSDGNSSTEMATAMTGSGLNFAATDSIGLSRTYTFSLRNEPTVAADVLMPDSAIGRFDFRLLEFKNPKLKLAFDKFLAHYYS
jgi:hypothetical protein